MRVRPETVNRRPTPTELRVLRLVAAGRTNREIADELGIAEESVKSHVLLLRLKLGASNRAAAVAQGYERGYLGTGA